MTDTIHIEVTVADMCNKKCAYCFEQHQHKQISQEMMHNQLAIISNICEILKKDGCNSLSISFWGGEPFTNVSHMIDIVNITRQYDFVKWHVYTNGTLFDEIKTFVSFLKQNNIHTRMSFQLSYDGKPHHEEKRRYSSDELMRTAFLLKNNEIAFDFKATLSFDMLCKLPSIWKSYEELYNQFGDFIKYAPTLDTTTSTLEYIDDWKQSLENIIKLEYDFIRCHGHPLMSWFTDSHKATCNMHNGFHVHSDGNVYICHGCPYSSNKSNFIISSKFDAQHIFNVIKTHTIDYSLPPQCINCCATYCSVCHITQIHENEDPYRSWSISRCRNNARCKYFKIFGHFSRLLKYASLKGKII